MAGLKQLRSRVKSIKSTQKITKAMQVVAASKLKRVKEQAEDLNDYSRVLECIMYNISKNINNLDLCDADRRFFSNKLMDLPHLLVVMTSERGLCGGFNSSVIKRLKKDIEELKAAGKQVKLIIVGKKGNDVLKRVYKDLILSYYNISKNNSECVAVQIKEQIVSLIEERKIGACYVYYNKFKNAITQIMTKEQVLPVENPKQVEDDGLEPEYEGEGLIREVIDLYINGLLNYALLQSKASEEAARMTAMDNATRNAGELIDKLTLKLNRSRQAIITTELTEIISGAEAL